MAPWGNFVEIVDDAGRPVPPGTEGNIVVTCLTNYAMPLLRYRLGDFAELGSDCSCGRGLPVLKRILGRERNSVLIAPSGERFWPVFGTHRFSRIAPIIPRFSTLFGVSPRTRFDLIVNQFVLEALLFRKLVLFQGNYRRSFVHVRDVVRALQLFATAPIDAVRNQVFNVGAEDGNYTKAQIIELIRRNVDGVDLEERDLTFGSDMRDVAVSCRKIRERLGFEASTTPEEGIREVRDAITWGLIKEPQSPRYRNHDLVIR